MNNILDKLEEQRDHRNDDASKHIATELYSNFKSKKLLTIKELSNKCYVAESTITAFSKKMGYSGYRELQLDLKKQIDNYSAEIIFKMESDEFEKMEIFRKLVQETLKSIKLNYHLLIEIADSIRETKKVFIYCSTQLKNVTEDFIDVLSTKNCNIIYNQYIFNSIKNIERISEDDTCLFYISGQDTKSIINVYEQVIKKTDKVFIFTSEAQKNVFAKNKNKLICIDHNILPNLGNIRRMIVNFYNLQIINIL